MEMIKNPHPGEMLMEDFLIPLGMSPTLGMPRITLRSSF